jgi:hypothetical protein
VKGRFKLGQDERDDTFQEILAGVQRDGKTELHEWMAEFAERSG